MWWGMPLTTTLGRQRQTDFCDFWGPPAVRPLLKSSSSSSSSSSSDLRRRDVRTGWPEEPAADAQFKRRSCQMEFEEGMVEGRARGEELAALGKQTSFSGSVEVIEVS